MKRLDFVTVSAGVLVFAALGVGRPATAEAGWGFGFDIFGPTSSFSYHQHGPVYPPPIYAPPPARVYHFHAPDCYAPAYYAPPPCFRPFHHHHHHHHHHGW